MPAPRNALAREQLRLLLVSVPVLLGVYFLVGEIGTFADRPVLVAMVLLPLVAVVVGLGMPLVRQGRVLLGGGFLAFFVAWCVLFAFLAGTRVLEGPRAVIEGLEGGAPPNVLGLNWLEDWHYRFAAPAPSEGDLLVVTVAPQPVLETRRALLDLLVRATNAGAKGIAFDYYFPDSTAIDRILCVRIAAAESARVPVVLGYTPESPLTPGLARCVPPERRGTLIGLREADGVVRMVPTSHQGLRAQRAFSYRIAALLAPETPLPDVDFVQFARPRSLPDRVPADTSALEGLMRDRFVIVGSSRAGDVYATPFGSFPGVMIHAIAVEGLRSGAVIRRLGLTWSLPIVFLLCYLLTLLQARGVGVAGLWSGTAAVIVATFAAAIFAMKVNRTWIDVSYPVLAVTLLSVVLTGGARWQGARARAAREAAARSAAAPEGTVVEMFDVFMSYNRRDQDEVLPLAESLRARGLHVWLDQWELQPGLPWQQEVEKVLGTVGAATVTVGGDGIGPWELEEVRVILEMCVRRKMRVIPVLLPGAAAQPELPLFLAGRTWVDLRAGVDERGLDALEWGITNRKPATVGRRIGRG